MVWWGDYSMMPTRQGLGAFAEQEALQHLEQQGLTLVARNWRCPQGELDLVMYDGATLVFVEVRYRRHHAWGGALESIDARKQQRLVRAAQAFLVKETQWINYPCRFDVIAMTGAPTSYHLEWIANAFDS